MGYTPGDCRHRGADMAKLLFLQRLLARRPANGGLCHHDDRHPALLPLRTAGERQRDAREEAVHDGRAAHQLQTRRTQELPE